MKTVFLSIILIVFGWVAWKASLTLLNIAGLPGALVAWKANKNNSVAGALRFGLGVLVSLAGQSYVYLAWVALIVNFTKHGLRDSAALAAVVWPFAFIASFMPVYFCAAAGTVEADQGFGEWNTQVYAIMFCQVVAIIGFFIFAFFPSVILLGWPWTEYVAHWLEWW